VSLIFEQKLDASTYLGIWKITEPVELMKQLLGLDDIDKKFFETISNELRKKHWLSSRLILQKLIPDKNLRIIYDEYGKPVMPFFNGNFSVSHSGDFAAAIVSSEMEVGIDIEKIRDRIERLADRFLTVEELSWTGTGNRYEKLLICWGAKESLYKIHGKPDIDFQKDLRIEPFDYLCIGEGTCKASMNTPDGLEFYNVCYRRIEDYMLVWAVKNKIFDN
jgi:phosphopantetheinyl transferase